MPRKTKITATADQTAQPPFSAAALEQLIPGPVTSAELENIFQQFKKAVFERDLGAEMSHHLGYAPGQAKPEGIATNHRNGKSAKTVLTDGAGYIRTAASALVPTLCAERASKLFCTACSIALSSLKSATICLSLRFSSSSWRRRRSSDGPTPP